MSRARQHIIKRLALPECHMDTPSHDRKTRTAAFASLPYLTAELPGVGGTLKAQPDDFVVEEIAAYEPCGTGEHLFLWVEKRDVSGEELLRHVARRLGVRPADIGMAGVKDRRAVTRQWISIPARYEAHVAQITSDRVQPLRSARHGNKLRTGHLRGNRFSLVLRDVADGAADEAERTAEVIGRLGFPNYFGEQRFGQAEQTLQLGLDLIGGRASVSSIPHAKRRFLLRMALSAVQSALFNAVLAARLTGGRLHTVLPGDVMQVVESGGPFVVEDRAAEQRRFDARETVITGPIFGPKMRAPQGETAELERAVLDDWGLTAADFTRFSQLTSGTRRPLLVWPTNLIVEAGERDLRLDFELPSGSYATCLLREFMKSAAVDGESAAPAQ
jgi:tRNA pseudouridine13 synthase